MISEIFCRLLIILILPFLTKISDAKGLDTNAGKAQRDETMEILRRRLKLLYGNMGDASHSTGLCIGQKIR